LDEDSGITGVPDTEARREHNPDRTMSCMLQVPENDPRVMACAAQLLARFSTRMLHPPRLPRPYETLVLDGLSTSVGITFAPPGDGAEDPVNIALLQRLWAGAFGPDVPFQRFSRNWRKLGFQHDTDPASDFRGGGRLSLECLVYLVERHPSVARGMLAKRRNRTLQRGAFANYPWACAGITVTKKLCELLGVCCPRTGRPKAGGAGYRDVAATYWHVAGSFAAFFELFVWSFAALDGLWDQLGATYMDFPRVVAANMQRTADILHRLPSDVVPSARSRPCANDDSEGDGDGDIRASGTLPWGIQGPVLGSTTEDGDDSDDDDDDDDEGKDEHKKASEAAAVSGEGEGHYWDCEHPRDDDGCGPRSCDGDLRRTDRLEDLLGLAHYSQPAAQLDETAGGPPACDFFEEYGLGPCV
jgi:hypothetical protein